MKKLLVFHPALAPYRVDQFNALSKLFELEVVFVFDNVWNHKFDQGKLTAQLEFEFSYLLSGIRLKGRVFRFGMLATIRRFNPDIILGYEFSFTTQYLILLKRLNLIDQKIGSTIDDSIEICHNVQSNIRSIARKQTVKQLDFLIVLSNEVSSYYQSEFKVNQDQVIVSPILQNSERLRQNHHELELIANRYAIDFGLRNKKVLLFVGRFIPEKGLIDFLKIIYPIIRSLEDFVFVLIGDGADKQQIEKFIVNKNIEFEVLLPGRFEGPELYAWYLVASGFVLPSKYEPFGAVVNEALIFGLRVLCSELAGSSGLIGDNGLLFNPNDMKDTVTKFNHFIDSLIPLKDINQLEKPSLMKDNVNDFLTEWKKLYYD